MSTAKKLTSAEVDQTIRAIGAFGLPGALAHFPPEPLTPQESVCLLAEISAARVTGLAVEATRHGDLLLDESAAEALHRAHETELIVALELERLMLYLVDECAARGIEYRVLKGPTCAHLDYPDPSLRSFIDIDFLVRGTDFDPFLQFLVSQGFSRLDAAPRIGINEKFTKSATVRSPAGYEVDVHRTLATGPLGMTIAVEDLWSYPQAYSLAGVEVLGMSQLMRFMHACYHAVLGDDPPRLVPLRDIAEMILFGAVSAPAVIATATAWRGQAVVARAVRAAWDRLQLADVTTLDTWARDYAPTPTETAQLATYAAGTSYATKVLAAAAVLSTRDKLSLLGAWAWPQQAFLDHHRISRAGWLRRGIRRTRHK